MLASTIDDLVRALYESISGPPGPRDYDTLRGLFAEGATLTRTISGSKPSARHVMTVDEFVDLAKDHFSNNGFFESEIFRKVDRFGHIASVTSTYECRRSRDELAPFARGVNAIQLFFDDERFYVHGMIWDDESPASRIPPALLPVREAWSYAGEEEAFAASVVTTARVVAVVGMKNESAPSAAAFTVPRSMKARGIRLIPVNPTIEAALGEPALKSVAELTEKVDVLQVFRRSEAVGTLADEVLTLPYDRRPTVVWLQSGIVHEAARARLTAAGIHVVMDRCFAVDLATYGTARSATP